MKTPKPRKKIKHVELWLRCDDLLYVVDPNDGVLICYPNGRSLEGGAGDILSWGDWVRIPKYRTSKGYSIFNFEFIGEFK